MTMRTREQGVRSGPNRTEKRTTFGGSVSTVDYGAAFALQVGETKTTTDVVTPGYHARVARGDIINNMFASETINVSNSFSGHIIQKNSGSGSTVKIHEYQPAYVVPDVPYWEGWRVDLGDAINEACTEAAARVDQTQVDGAVEAAEGRQTMNLFNVHQYNLRRQLVKEIRYAEKRGKKFPASVPASVMANNWLLARYGLSPFLRLLHDTIVVGSRIQTLRQTSRGFAATGGSRVETTVSNGVFHDATVVRNLNWDANVRAGILYERKAFSNKYGFSLANLPAAAWEVTPWSFVFDWFVNMGDFIRALTPRVQLVRRATWYGYALDIQDSYSVTLSALKVAGYTVTKAQSGTVECRIAKRRRHPNIQAPVLYIRENALSEIVTSQRIVDAFALTTQLFLKYMRRS